MPVRCVPALPSLQNKAVAKTKNPPHGLMVIKTLLSIYGKNLTPPPEPTTRRVEGSGASSRGVYFFHFGTGCACHTHRQLTGTTLNSRLSPLGYADIVDRKGPPAEDLAERRASSKKAIPSGGSADIHLADRYTPRRDTATPSPPRPHCSRFPYALSKPPWCSV